MNTTVADKAKTLTRGDWIEITRTNGSWAAGMVMGGLRPDGSIRYHAETGQGIRYAKLADIADLQITKG